MRHPDKESYTRILIPLKLVIALFISIKIMPNNYISSFQFALESGVKGYKRFSPSYGRLYEIIFLGVSIIIVGFSILGLQVYYLATNSYDASVSRVIYLIEELQRLSQTFGQNNIYVINNLSSCVYNSFFLIIVGLGLTFSFIITNIVLYYLEWFNIKKSNKPKTGILRMNNLIFYYRQIGVLGSVILCADVIITYIFYFRICDIFALKELSQYSRIYAMSNHWHTLTTIISFIISIAISFETLKIIAKLILCYRHKRKVIEAIKKQEAINKGYYPVEFDKYKGYDSYGSYYKDNANEEISIHTFEDDAYELDYNECILLSHQKVKRVHFLMLPHNYQKIVVVSLKIIFCNFFISFFLYCGIMYL